ncbi:LCP family protein [Streptomyces otsuchiensis]|uniref:LCP family protein n=1 Tax=Streptomyces otsuchiensis TaxID=2681388 RepID=UPI00102F41B5|nr:LCP family protein [Streptomyces otsuchiensis]
MSDVHAPDVPSRRRRGRARRVLLWTFAAVTVAVLATGGWLYYQVSGKLRSVDINAELEERGAERPESREDGGRAILVLGSDSGAAGERNGREATDGDGGDDGGAGADGEDGDDGDGPTGSLPADGSAMVVRLPADGSSPTAVGIPHTFPVPRPPCADAPGAEEAGAAPALPFHSVRSAGGASCVVQVVEELSGLRMDHYIEVDFAGFGALVDALGGIDVDLPEPVLDERSGLRLDAGPQRLDGDTALTALRAVGGEAQQRFLLALIAEIDDQDVLGSPTTLYRVAEAAAGSLTTDAGLGSVPDLVAFARDLSAADTSGLEVLALPANRPDAEPVWESLRGADATP